jgi:hypothetical protein
MSGKIGKAGCAGLSRKKRVRERVFGAAGIVTTESELEFSSEGSVLAFFSFFQVPH